MDDLNSIVTVVSRITLLMLSALFLGWAFLPEHRPLCNGLILGLAAGLVYVRFLSAKVRGLVNLVVSQEKKRYSFGFITRICLVFVTVMIAAKFEQVSMIGAIIGVFVPQILTIPASIVISLRNKS
ncbi:ATP synthase protein I [Fontibacillus phaseoli]|uniref:ATP synthase protein I n=1 Tax=Fontibacillus phaseoli TaxID=1416533 RepID=A0A369BEY9_9BACL|nr:ATP synthase subunit I [Fontibacillus phaseoli]RCX19126.1 ATP synthase protein I [Fontibacillus phaseoli]